MILDCKVTRPSVSLLNLGLQAGPLQFARKSSWLSSEALDRKVPGGKASAGRSSHFSLKLAKLWGVSNQLEMGTPSHQMPVHRNCPSVGLPWLGELHKATGSLSPGPCSSTLRLGTSALSPWCNLLNGRDHTYKVLNITADLGRDASANNTSLVP